MNEKLQQFERKMQKSYDNLLEEFGAIRAGRANPHVLDRITVEYYGVPTAGGECYSSRGAHDSDSALGALSGQGD